MSKEDVYGGVAGSSSNDGSGVVYVGHLPHGFYEEQITGYCSQFGVVKRVKVARSKKTGRSRGYAFIEFECDEVAKVVAETMNNYLMFNKLLKCKILLPIYMGKSLHHPPLPFSFP